MSNAPVSSNQGLSVAGAILVATSSVRDDMECLSLRVLAAEIERLRAALEDVAANPANRKRYYDFRQYMSHINGCKGGGDQACACGKASIAWNLDELIEGAERAFSVLEAAPAVETTAEQPS